MAPTPIEPVSVVGLAQISSARHRDPIAAGGRDAAHRDDDGPIRLLEALELAQDDVRRKRAAAAGIDAQHERFDVLVGAR